MVYLIKPAYTNKGNTIYRGVGVSGTSMTSLVDWYARHKLGREATKNSFGEIHFNWRDPVKKKVADFPSCGDPGGIWSQKAVDSIGGMLLASGDLHSLIFEDPAYHYFLYDCWAKVEAVANDGFTSFIPSTLKSIMITPGTELPDVFMATSPIGLMVSEKFKLATEAAGLTGMVFTEVEVHKI